jgi:hypothetical protein
MIPMPDRYPGYDVLRKRDTPSWNDKTREVVDARLALPDEPHFFSWTEWAILRAACDRIVPQPDGRPPIPTAALLDNKLHKNETEGYRNARLPPMREAWRRGVAALDAEARAAHQAGFAALTPAQQDALLKRMQDGELSGPAWGEMPAELFFSERFAHDIVEAYFSHPTAWNEMGWGGPASPRGYVRMGFNRRDAWEPVEAHGDDAPRVREINEHVR